MYLHARSLNMRYMKYEQKLHSRIPYRIIRAYTIVFYKHLHNRFTTTAPYFLSLYCCSRPEYWTPLQRLTTAIPGVVPDNERMAIHSDDYQQLRMTTPCEHASSPTFSFSELVRRHSGGDKSICWSHHSDGAGTTLRYQGLLSTHVTLNFPFFRSVFSRDRFLQIFWMLHVGDIPTTTKRSKIQPFLDLIIPLFQRHLTPTQELSIDEAMIAFRGRVGFRQYIRGKPQPWGIKAYVLSESRTGYMYNLVIYYGKDTQLLTQPGLNHTTNVVLTLMYPLKDLGYDLYTDRFYTSPILATELLDMSTTLTGTVMCNRKNMPAATKNKKQKKGDGGHIL